MQKKAIITIIILIIFALAIAFAFSACENTEEVVLVSVSIEEGSIDTAFFQNEELDLTEAHLILSFSDGNQSVIDITEDMIESFSTQTIGDHTLVVSYQGRNTTLNYTVNVDSNLISVVSVQTVGFKTEYYVNEPIDYSEAVLQVTYSDDSIENISITEGMIKSTFNSNNATASPRTLSLSVDTKGGIASCSILYTVIQRASIHSFSVKHTPELVFQQNALTAVSERDIILAAQDYAVVYSDDLETEVEVSFADMTVSGFSTTEIGTFELTLKFTDEYGRKKDLKLTYQIIAPVEEYDITYNQDYIGGSSITTSTINGYAPIRPNPSRVGYDFLGWFRKDSLDQFYNTPWNFTEQVSEDMTLYARWAKIDYTINYVGISPTSPNRQYTKYDIEYNISFYPETKTGYVFEGFSTGEEIITAISKGTTGNLTLTAVWTPVEYNITYNLMNGDAPETPNPTKYTIESDILLNVPTRTGYEFGGWENNSTQLVINRIERGSFGEITLNAVWNVITYSITYNLGENEYIVGSHPTSYKITDVNLNLPVPTKTYYTFAGWFLNEDLTVEQPKSGSNYVIFQGSYGDITLYPKFYRNYEITFNQNSGESVSKVLFTEITTTVVLPSTTRAGYEFAGWKAEYSETVFEAGNNSTDDIKAEISSGYNIQLIAQWDILEYTITYMDGDIVLGEENFTIEDEITLREVVGIISWEESITKIVYQTGAKISGYSRDLTFNAIYE